MKYLVFYTIVSCLQIPLLAFLSKLFIGNREKPENDGWGYWQWQWLSIICIIAPYHSIAFDSLFLPKSFPQIPPHVIPLIITIFCIGSLPFSYYFCVYKQREKDWHHRDSCGASFIGMTAYCIGIIAYAWWIFNR